MEGIIVILLLIVAIVVFLLYTRARHPKTPAAVELTRRLGTVRYMSGAQFEGFVAEIMRGLGYRATVLGGSGDQGVDVIATAGKERIAIQCKNYAKPVGNKPVQEVYAGSRYHGCNSEWVVAPTGFTKGAVELARRLGVTLYDAQAIRTWIRRIDEKERDRGKKKPALQPRGTVDLDAGSAGQKEDTAMESGMEKHTMYVGKETLGETVSFTAKLLGIAGVNGGKEAERGFDFSYYRLPDHTYRVLIDSGDLAVLMPSNMLNMLEPSNISEAWARGEPVEYGRWTLEELQAEQDFGRVFRELMKKYPESKQRVVRDLEEEEGAPEFEKGSGGIAGMGVCVDDVLASVRGVVDLSPHEALDEAQEFLTRQGYSLTYRTTTTLTFERQVSENATGQESIFKLIVIALPQSGGGVRIKVRGNDREAVRDHQAAWLEWSESLPKRETEQPEAAATMESVTREIVGQEAPRPTTAAANNAPQSRYCSNCGRQLAEDDRFCANCGTPVDEAAHEPPPEADWWRIPPAAERNALERILFGTGTADTTPPQLNLPADITKEATGPADAQVSWQAPTATDVNPAHPIVSCSPASGSTFAIGTTTVNCSATDAANNTANGSFTVTVQDTTSPNITNVPSDIITEATSSAGATVTFTKPTATDIVDGALSSDKVSCDHQLDDPFPIGTTTVTCSATDSSGNTASASFNVTVKGTTEQVTNLKDDIANLNLPAGTNTSLSTTLQQAQSSIDADNISAALGQLDAFINQVKALEQRGKLSSQKAADLISSAEQIKVVLGG